ncbi:phasin family protein [Pseudooceanicola sp. C21-150M6]|uniref:phasin family protein n=1 Tax=Pseudooceanicola sp. C21-150M6 TaxID=3434355 RepID=UPI003D7F43F4
MAEKKDQAAADTASMMANNPAAKMMTTCMEMGAEIMAFGARRMEKDVSFQKDMLSATPQDMFHIQAAFWQQVVEDYQAESQKLLNMAHIGKTTKD